MKKFQHWYSFLNGQKIYYWNTWTLHNIWILFHVREVLACSLTKVWSARTIQILQKEFSTAHWALFIYHKVSCLPLVTMRRYKYMLLSFFLDSKPTMGYLSILDGCRLSFVFLIMNLQLREVLPKCAHFITHFQCVSWMWIWWIVL